ncbi:hypothetical protein [Aneurinibacillus tyrosinisolvens]|uniref:hypothetical protein n=1 Tax=Aneurinibacillus tyrosinisolvens TaxID=1443435 RepID=UPI00063EDF48|nr:hypothetical protein [Aneurinibacillus tyrosinisolvens]
MPLNVYILQPNADFHTITAFLQQAGYKQKTLNDYSYFIDHRECHARVGLEGTITFQINEHISLPALEKVRWTIIDTKNEVGGTIAEGNYHIGYLEDGTKASLFSNWEEWLTFLYGARYKAIEGNYVRVYDPQYNLLEDGILESYHTGNDSDGISRIVSCSLRIEEQIRELAAERFFIVEATGEFGNQQ